jgi:hypothetical protein
MAWSKVLKELQAFDSGIDAVIIDRVKDQEQAIVAANAEQLFSGILATGRPTKPDYAQSTIARKRRKGQPTNRVTLKDTGKFHISLKVDYREKEFELTSDDTKRVYLERKYGRDIYGLTDANLQRVIDRLENDLLTELKKRLGI